MRLAQLNNSEPNQLFAKFSSLAGNIADNLGVMLAISFLVAAFLILNYFNILSLQSILPALSFLPHQNMQQNNNSLTQIYPTPSPDAIPATNINDCQFKKGDNPVVSDLEPLSMPDRRRGMIGLFLGNLNSFNYNPSTQTADLGVLSPKGDQLIHLSLTEKNGLVRDTRKQVDGKLADLKVGMSLSISFTCVPANAKLTVTSVAIN